MKCVNCGNELGFEECKHQDDGLWSCDYCGIECLGIRHNGIVTYMYLLYEWKRNLERVRVPLGCLLVINDAKAEAV